MRFLRLRCVALLALLLVASAPARAAERSETAAKYKWDLRDLYRTPEDWQKAKDALARRIPILARYQGRLGVSADTLATALETWMDLDRELSRVGTYASQLHDEDTRIAKNLQMTQSVEDLRVQFSTATSWIRPQIIALGSTKVRRFLAAEPRLANFRMLLENLLRYEPHTLSAAEEKVVARAGIMAGAGESVRDMFSNAEMPYPEITLPSTKERVRLDAQAYTQYRAAPNRADRDSVFRAFWRAHREFQGTFGAALNAEMRAHVFYRDVHKYKTCLEAAQFGDNIPTSVYTQLIRDTHANLPTLHRYLRLRKRMMGVSTLRYEDLYAPIVKEVDLHYTPEQAMQLTLEAVKPLGTEYGTTLKQGFEHGWVDWLPNTGKASGAYSTGAYGVHPYQLQNFTGLYDEVSTLAHESGHSMHTWYADKTQPYVNHDYATFVAEVASTLNENLLFHSMLDRTKDKPTRLFLLGSYLDNLRTTLFRQVLFAEFELAIHEMAERGEPLTGENLTALYLKIVRQYYGHAQGVCKVDDLYGVEWAYIDHFFYNFYVYQYATSIVAATALANGIRPEATLARAPHRDAYLKMLSSGSSKYPIDLLKDAGVDMTTSAPFRAAIREMNTVMDEMEKLLR